MKIHIKMLWLVRQKIKMTSPLVWRRTAPRLLRADWICLGVGTSKLLWCCGDHERRAVTRDPSPTPSPSRGLRDNAVRRGALLVLVCPQSLPPPTPSEDDDAGGRRAEVALVKRRSILHVRVRHNETHTRGVLSTALFLAIYIYINTHNILHNNWPCR